VKWQGLGTSLVIIAEESRRTNLGVNARMSEDLKQMDFESLKALVRTVPDFPKPGILF
jgi:hypothetical protein